jgi:anti-anti-sigma factor
MLKPSIQVHNIDGVFVAEFWDCLRLDSGAVQELRSKADVHLRGGGRPELVIDLLGVGFAGSASLGHFVALQRLARTQNGRLIFCNVDPMVYDVFKVSKLVPLFLFVSDRAAALAQVLNPAAGAAPPADSAINPEAKPSAPSVQAPQNSGGTGLLRSSRRRKLS